MRFTLTIVQFKNAVNFKFDHLHALVKLVFLFFLFVQIVRPSQHHLHLNLRLLQNARQFRPNHVGEPLHLAVTLDEQINQLIDFLFKLIQCFSLQNPLFQQTQELIYIQVFCLLIGKSAERLFTIALLAASCTFLIALLVLLVVSRLWLSLRELFVGKHCHHFRR